MNNNTAATTTVTCPRCHGFDNAFTRFGHIANGKCLRCLGAKTIEVSTAKLNSERAVSAEKQRANLDAHYSQRPYAVLCDGVECVAESFSTWGEAHAELKDRRAYNADLRIAKWDGECFRYRDGASVKFLN